MHLVSDIMARDPGWLGPEDTIATAWQMMREHRVRHLPVCKDDRLVGLVTQKDLLVNIQHTNLLSLPVAEIMVQDVHTIEIDMTAESAARMMRDMKVSCLPVVDDGRLIGLVTDTDFLNLVVSLLQSE